MTMEATPATMHAAELTLIVAATRNMGIGLAGTMPWKGLRKEMQYFARVTSRLPPQVRFPMAHVPGIGIHDPTPGGVSLATPNDPVILIPFAGNQVRCCQRCRHGPQDLGLHPSQIQASQGSSQYRRHTVGHNGRLPIRCIICDPHYRACEGILIRARLTIRSISWRVAPFCHWRCSDLPRRSGATTGTQGAADEYPA